MRMEGSEAVEASRMAEAAEAAEVVAKMQTDLICPICLDYLNDPVTSNCGHNFCESCINGAWKDLLAGFPCPVCRQPHEEKHVSANPQLGRLVDLARILHSSGSSERMEKKEPRCEEHNQVLSLFCEDDQAPVCLLCAQCPAHQGHNMKPVAEAVKHHRLRLRGDIASLKQRLAELQELEVTQDRNLLWLRREVKGQRDRLASEYEQLIQAVEQQQEAALGWLTGEDRRLQKQLGANLAVYSDHISALQGLLEEVAERSVMEDGAVLREVRGLQQRCDSVTPPALQPLRFRQAGCSLPPLCSNLSKLMDKFHESISLDPQTAHPLLRVSSDGQTVTCVRKRLRTAGKAGLWADAAELEVLGREGFASGRHYWEVQVGDKPEWAVGVCSDAPGSQAQRPRAGPKRCWTIQLQDGHYLAVGSVLVPLAVKGKPTGIGVYLDCELGQVSFYDSRDRCHLHSFCETFAQVLKPYIRVGQDSAPLTVGAGRASQGGGCPGFSQDLCGQLVVL